MKKRKIRILLLLVLVAGFVTVTACKLAHFQGSLRCPDDNGLFDIYFQGVSFFYEDPAANRKYFVKEQRCTRCTRIIWNTNWSELKK